MNRNNSNREHGSGDGFDRRTFIRLSALGALGLGLSDQGALGADAMQSAKVPTPTTKTGLEPKARTVIQLWMGGGPPHTDTFDPKPEAGEDYCGPFRRAIDTNVPGIRLCETMPMMAKQADKFSIIRGMTHKNNGHETATYMMQTGTPGSSDLVYPSIGAVVAFKKEQDGSYKGSLPPYIALTSALGRFNEAGFLGVNYRMFAPGGDPNAKEFRVQGIVPAQGMTQERLKERRDLAAAVDGLARAAVQPEAVRDIDALQEKAYKLILGDAKEAFDMSKEPDSLRDRFGRHHFGQSCLLARRLAERGAPFITVNWGGWDTHKNHFDSMKKMLPQLDQGFSALLEDLAARGLLDSTIVTWYGEFGRTPRIDKDAPWFYGRGHHGAVFSAVVAGGGFKGGHVIGSSDSRGETVKDRPVYPWDLSASMYKLLGIDPMGKLPHPQGCVAYVTALASGGIQTGGMLKEIM